MSQMRGARARDTSTVASRENRVFLNHLGQDIAFPQDFIFGSVDFDVGSAVLAVQHFIAFRHGNLTTIATFEQTTGTDSDNFATLWLLLGGIWQHDPAGGHFFCLNGGNNNTIIEWI